MNLLLLSTGFKPVSRTRGQTRVAGTVGQIFNLSLWLGAEFVEDDRQEIAWPTRRGEMLQVIASGNLRSGVCGGSRPAHSTLSTGTARIRRASTLQPGDSTLEYYSYSDVQLRFEMNDTAKRIVSKMLDEIILRAAPGASTVSKYGGVLYTVKPDENHAQFCGIFVYKNHVQLSLANGTFLKDPKGVLLGDGKYRRHVNFASPDEVDSKVLIPLLKQSAKLTQQ